jgi:hypothetical protein
MSKLTEDLSVSKFQAGGVQTDISTFEKRGIELDIFE